MSADGVVADPPPWAMEYRDEEVDADAATEDTAREADREADRVVREVLAKHQLTAEVALDRWHPLEQDWVDASARCRKPPSSWQRSTSVAWRTKPRSPSRPGGPGTRCLPVHPRPQWCPAVRCGNRVAF